ncbi:MAG TPA: (Fe-S)-binding protein, partial [Methanocella sp.]|nr:(Fe-S)-binding protein [Methanocella sp.]
MDTDIDALPGLDCGMCGVKTCEQFAEIIRAKPEERKRCVQASGHRMQVAGAPASPAEQVTDNTAAVITKDSLGRGVNFILDKNPEDMGPRETIIPHNPLLTREMEIKKGDVLIGRPLGMSCGCPVAHSGMVTDV